MKSTLTPQQVRYVSHRVTARSLKAAAKAAGVSERTAQRWEAAPQVQAALRAAADEVLTTAARVASGKLLDAVDALVDIMGDVETPAGARVQAARAILDAAPRLVDLADMARRLSELEAANRDK